MRGMLKCISPVLDAYFLSVEIYVCVLNLRAAIYMVFIDDLNKATLTVDCLCLCVYYRNGDC